MSVIDKEAVPAAAKGAAAKRQQAPAVIGKDIGHSTVKIAAGGKHELFPTAAIRAINISVAEAARAASGDTVDVGDHKYFIGQTAVTQSAGKLLDGLRDDWIETPEHVALLKAGFYRGIAALEHTDNPMLVLGLPSRLHGSQQKRLAELAAMHLQIGPERVRVLPQPLGAFMALALDESGEPVATRNYVEERWGVIDVGYYTTDFGLIDGGVWSEAGSHSIAGASSVASALRDMIEAAHHVNLPLRQCDDILRARATTIYGRRVDLGAAVDELKGDFAQKVAEAAIQVFGDSLPTLDGILLAGGGAELISADLKSQWPHVLVPKNARFTVAEGLRRYGLLLSKPA